MTADPDALRDHLNELRLQGGTYRTIAAAAAVAPTTVHDLVVGAAPEQAALLGRCSPSPVTNCRKAAWTPEAPGSGCAPCT